MERTKEVDVLRFWFTIVICLHHLRYCSESLPYGGGYIAVDFFFILSGFYLRKEILSYSKNKELSVFSFAKKRYSRLMKDYSLSFLMAFIVNLFVLKRQLSNNIVGYIREGLMVEYGSLHSDMRINPPDWYCSYLLLVSIVIFVFVKLFKKNITLLSMLSAGAIYIALYLVYGHINIYPENVCILSIAFFRAFAGMTVGVFLCDLVRKQEKSDICKKPILKGIYVFLILFLSYMMLWDDAYSYTDYVCVGLLTVLVYLSQIVKFRFVTNKFNKFWQLLPEISYVMFLNHYLFVRLFKYYNVFMKGDWKIISLLYLIIVFVFSYCVLNLRKHFVQ